MIFRVRIMRALSTKLSKGCTLQPRNREPIWTRAMWALVKSPMDTKLEAQRTPVKQSRIVRRGNLLWLKEPSSKVSRKIDQASTIFTRIHQIPVEFNRDLWVDRIEGQQTSLSQKYKRLASIISSSHLPNTCKWIQQISQMVKPLLPMTLSTWINQIWIQMELMRIGSKVWSEILLLNCHCRLTKTRT